MNYTLYAETVTLDTVTCTFYDSQRPTKTPVVGRGLASRRTNQRAVYVTHRF